ncbi:MAG: DUF5659 domain-containing protein [Acidobacteriia bacterium]|nr:DUF5659 domain-containing protein [Terriglobia bacterium]
MPNGYNTAYLLLASFLTAKGEHIAKVLATDQRVVFSFEDSPTLAQHITGFSGNENIPITDFVNAFRNVKDLLRAALEQKDNQLRDPGAEPQRAGVE